MKMPLGVPGAGERVDADPANWLRDLFLANKGRLPVDEFNLAFGRMTFTYGWRLHKAWQSLQDEGYAQRQDDEWVWPLQVQLIERGI